MTTYQEEINDGIDIQTPEELPEFYLSRVAQDQNSTFGVLTKGKVFPVCVTVENKWDGNTPFISCIPDGSYICERGHFDKASWSDNPDGISYKILEVPNRYNCIFHPGNSHFDTSGCILPNSNFGTTWNKKYGVNAMGGQHSRLAHEDFMMATNGLKQFRLYIRSICNDNS